MLLDEKTVVFDTVDKAVSDRFFENIEHVLNGKAVDYLKGLNYGFMEDYISNHDDEEHSVPKPYSTFSRRLPEVYSPPNHQPGSACHSKYRLS